MVSLRLLVPSIYTVEALHLVVRRNAPVGFPSLQRKCASGLLWVRQKAAGQTEGKEDSSQVSLTIASKEEPEFASVYNVYLILLYSTSN